MKKISVLIIFILTSSTICKEQLHTTIFKEIPENIRKLCAVLEICSSINSNEKVNKACGRLSNGLYCSTGEETPEKKEFCKNVNRSKNSFIHDLMIIKEELNLHPELIVECCKENNT